MIHLRRAVLTMTAVAILGCKPAPRPRPPLPDAFRSVNPSTGREVALSYSATPISMILSATWVSPQLGEMTLRQHDDEVVGDYQSSRDGCLVTGKIVQGKKEGNRVRFSWTDVRSGCAAQSSKGIGDFFFTNDESGARLFGRRRISGTDDIPDEVWTARPREDAGPVSSAGTPTPDPICATDAAPPSEGCAKKEAQ